MSREVQCLECGSFNTVPANVGAESIFKCLDCGNYVEDEIYEIELDYKRRRKKWDDEEDE